MGTEKIINELEKRLIELEEIAQVCSINLKNCPEGSLNICCKNGKFDYYYYTNGKPTYLSSKKEKQIAALESKGYYKKLQRATERQEEAIKTALKKLRGTFDPENVFINLPKERRHLIRPVSFQAPQRGIEQIAKYHAPVTKGSNLITLSGEKVKSKSELIIADRLKAAEVPYCYEPNLQLGDIMPVHPDFAVLNKRTGKLYYWEHLGMMDNPQYLQGAQIKLEAYALSGYFIGQNLLVSFETSQRPLNMEYVEVY